MGKKDWVVYGDGSQALLYDELNIEIKRDGTKVKPLLVAPNERTKKRYRLSDDDFEIEDSDNNYDGLKVKWIKYPQRHVKTLYMGADGSVTLIICAFDGNRTDLMYYYDELLELDRQRDKTEKQLRAQVSYLNKRLENAMAINTEQMRRLKVLQETVAIEQKKDDDDK